MASPAAGDRLTTRVVRVERTGAEIFALVEPLGLSDGVAHRGDHVVVRLDKRLDVQEGGELTLRVHLGEAMVFDPEGDAVR